MSKIVRPQALQKFCPSSQAKEARQPLLQLVRPPSRSWSSAVPILSLYSRFFFAKLFDVIVPVSIQGYETSTWMANYEIW